MDINKIKGILVGLALGDALGAPHEFKYNKLVYTGTLQHQVRLFNRFHGETIFPVGSITDDTQMTLALVNQIIVDNNYIVDNVILAYEKWAGVAKMLGKNTRLLFKGVTTVKGYRNRFAKQFETPIEGWTQSNGSLMRCSPFSLFRNYTELLTDVRLTNPHPVNQECGLVYIYIMKYLSTYNESPDINILLGFISQVDVIKVISDVKNKVIRDISTKAVKGWVCTALYCSLWSIYYIPTITEACKYFIEQKGDTDTNAAILGALYGARDGYLSLYNEQKFNIDVLLNANLELRNIDQLCQRLLTLNL